MRQWAPSQILAIIVAVGMFGFHDASPAQAGVDEYRSHDGFTRIVFTASVPLTYTIKESSGRDESSSEGRYLELAADSPSVFEGFAPVTIDDGMVRRLDMLESDGTRVIQIGLDAAYRSHRSYQLKYPDRLVVEIVGGVETQRRTPSGNIFVIDAGHGGKDGGAGLLGGGREKDISLDIAGRVRRILEKEGRRVVMTRNADYAVSDMERAATANKSRGDLFLSIHAASPPPCCADIHRVFVHDWRATEEMIEASRLDAEARPYLWGAQQSVHMHASDILARAMVEELEGKKGGLGAQATTPLPSPLLSAVLMPAVLVELRDSQETAGNFSTEANRQKIAEKIARAAKAAFDRIRSVGGAD